MKRSLIQLIERIKSQVSRVEMLMKKKIRLGSLMARRKVDPKNMKLMNNFYLIRIYNMTVVIKVKMMTLDLREAENQLNQTNLVHQRNRI